MIQPLESRRLLSVTLTSGVLTITGTARRDLIQIRHTATFSPSLGHLVPAVETVINGIHQERFADSLITSISILAGAGNDRVSIPFAHKTAGHWVKGLSIPCSVEGSAGGDILI